MDKTTSTTATQDRTATVTATSHFYTGRFNTEAKEEVYFNAEMVLPRVGQINVRFHADRYVARAFDEGSNVGRDAWTNWRVTRDYSKPISGVGPKGIEAMCAAVEPIIQVWLAGPEYAPSRRREIARFIAREASERYGLQNAKTLLAAHKDELNPEDFERLTRAIEHLEMGAKLLAGNE